MKRDLAISMIGVYQDLARWITMDMPVMQSHIPGNCNDYP
jgi:hypothetical protein